MAGATALSPVTRTKQAASLATGLSLHPTAHEQVWIGRSGMEKFDRSHGRMPGSGAFTRFSFRHPSGTRTIWWRVSGPCCHRCRGFMRRYEERRRCDLFVEPRRKNIPTLRRSGIESSATHHNMPLLRSFSLLAGRTTKMSRLRRWPRKFPARNFGWTGKFSGHNLQFVKTNGRQGGSLIRERST